MGANAVGEMLGLGTTFALLGVGQSYAGSVPGIGGILLGYGLAIVTGGIEATIVGLAQWRAMKPWLPEIKRHSWWLATFIGALIAYVLGYLPSTIMGLQEEANQTTAVEPDQWVILLLAAGLGLVGGLVLSLFQMRELRRHVPEAWKWLPANMLGWMFGMPLIFWGIDLIFKIQSVMLQIGLMAGILLLTGAIVGAVHGVVLVYLVKLKTSGLRSAS